MSHEKEDHEIECNICKQTYDTQAEKEPHIVKDHPQAVHACTKCDLTFRNTEELEQHVEITHMNLITYVCTQCDKSFQTENELEVHMEDSHHT